MKHILKFSSFLLFLILNSSFLISSVSAQTEKPISPAPTTVLGDTDSPIGLDDIQKIRQAVQQKVQEKLQNLSGTKNTKKGWIGSVTKIEATRLTISHNSQNRTLNVDPEATIIDEKRKKITLDQIKVGQNIVAMGDLATDNSLDTKRIIVYDPSTLTKKQIVVGKIADISQSSPIMVLIPTTNKNLQYQIKTDSSTESVSATNAKVDLKALTAGQRVVAVLKQDPKNPKSFTALKLISPDTLTSTSPTPTTKPTSN